MKIPLLVVWRVHCCRRRRWLGYLQLRNAPIGVQVALIGLASGFLVTTVAQSMIPAANRDGEPSLADIFFVGGISVYALMSVFVKS